jgi:hypothetical protein
MNAHRNKCEIMIERVDLFRAIKKSRREGMRYVDMLKHVFNYQQRAKKVIPCMYLHFDYHFDRNLINVHMPYLKRDGVVKCQDGRYRCLGFVPKYMSYKS